MAGSSSSITDVDFSYRYRSIEVTWVADDADGSVPDLTFEIQGQLVLLRTDPGTPAPTDNYDVTLEDDDGIDQLQSVGGNRSTSAFQEVLINYSGTPIHPYVTNAHPLTLKISNNSVNSATGTVQIIFIADEAR